jgi:hypothetical protein
LSGALEANGKGGGQTGAKKESATGSPNGKKKKEEEMNIQG